MASSLWCTWRERWQQLCLLLLIIVFLFLVVFRIDQRPATWFDEGINVGIAKAWVEEGVYSLRVGPTEFVQERPFLITTNYPVLAPVAASFLVFGTTLTAARLPMILFLCLFVFLAYVLVRRWYGKTEALITLALLVSFLPLYGNGRSVLGEIPGLCFFLIALLFLSSEQRIRLFCGGLALGLSAATKPYFLLVLPSVAIGELWMWKFGKRSLWPRCLWIVLGSIGPLCLWLFTLLPSPTLTGVRTMVGFYTNSYAATDVGFSIFANLLRFVTETTPLHFLLLLLVSGYGLWQTKRPRTLAEVTLLAFIGFTLLWYLKTPGWYRYFFPAHALLFFFAARGFTALPWKKSAYVLLGTILCFQSYMLLSKWHDPLYDSHEVADIATTLEAEYPRNTLVVNNPSLAFLLPSATTFQYLQINPSLFFGRSSFTDLNGLPYTTVVINGSLGETTLKEHEAVLLESYKVVHTIGHAVVYRHL